MVAITVTVGRTAPPPPDPPPETIAHGNLIPELYSNAKTVIGPQGTLTPMAGRLFTDGEVIENRLITGQVTVAPNARVIFNNCKMQAVLGQGSDVFRIQGAGAWVTATNCEITQRKAGAGGNSCIGPVDFANMELVRCIIRGGYDAMFLRPQLPAGIIPTGDPKVPFARILIQECLICDGERVEGAHADLLQLDDQSGTGRGYMVIRRSRFAAFTIPIGSDPLTTSVTDTGTAGMQSVCIITTGSATVLPHHILIEKCHFNGGNNVVQVRINDSWIIDCTWGPRFRFNPLSAGGTNLVVSNCTWGFTGTVTPEDGSPPFQVTQGELIPGSGP